MLKLKSMMVKIPTEIFRMKDDSKYSLRNRNHVMKVMKSCDEGDEKCIPV